MSTTDMTDGELSDLDIDAALDRVLVRHGELRRRRARRQRLAYGAVVVMFVVGGIGAFAMADKPSGGLNIGSGVGGSSSPGSVDLPSSTGPGSPTPEHDIVTGTPVPTDAGRWRLELHQTVIAPAPTPAPTATADPNGVMIGEAAQLERAVSPSDWTIIDGTLRMRFRCGVDGRQGTIVDGLLQRTAQGVAADISVGSGGSPCATDSYGAELVVALPFDPGPGAVLTTQLLR